MRWSLMCRTVLATFLLGFLVFLLGAPAAAEDAEDTSTGESEAGRLADHVILVSIDGLRPEFYLDPTWPAPMLQQLARDGAVAERVEGVFPSVTYPAHTTMITGVRPAVHGVFYNSPFEPPSDGMGATGAWYWQEDAIRVPTLWDLCRDAGLLTASLGWPVSVGAPIDHNVPEVWDPTGRESFVETARRHATRGLLGEIEREATGRLRHETFTIDYHTREDRAGDAAAWVFETYRPALLTLHLIATDHFQHEDGRDSDRVRRAVAAVDRALAQVWETAERLGVLDRTTFVVTGDHGHVDRHTKLRPNVLLAEAGLLDRARFHTGGASAFLHLLDPSDEAAAQRARRILDEQPPSIRSLYRILDRDELDRLGAAPEAALALALEPGVDAGSGTDGEPVGPAEGATHGYLPDAHPHIYTGLVASGAGIRSGVAAAELGLVVIAPLVVELLGLDAPPMEGQAPLGWLE